MDTTVLHDALRNEFTCYYQIDELPAPWTDEVLKTVWASRARDSASRLRHAVGEARVPDLIRVLEEMKQNPHHVVVQRIGSSTQMVWPDDPTDWRVFQSLLDGIIADLRTDSSTGIR